MYFQYKKREKTSKYGLVTNGWRCCTWCRGYGQLGSWEDETLMGVGGLAMAAGVGSGIYMRIAGKNKIKKVVRQYNSQQKQSYYPSSQLGFCLNDSGLGIRLVF